METFLFNDSCTAAALMGTWSETLSLLFLWEKQQQIHCDYWNIIGLHIQNGCQWENLSLQLSHSNKKWNKPIFNIYIVSFNKRLFNKQNHDLLKYFLLFFPLGGAGMVENISDDKHWPQKVLYCLVPAMRGCCPWCWNQKKRLPCTIVSSRRSESFPWSWNRSAALTVFLQTR